MITGIKNVLLVAITALNIILNSMENVIKIVHMDII